MFNVLFLHSEFITRLPLCDIRKDHRPRRKVNHIKVHINLYARRTMYHDVTHLGIYHLAASIIYERIWESPLGDSIALVPAEVIAGRAVVQKRLPFRWRSTYGQHDSIRGSESL